MCEFWRRWIYDSSHLPITWERHPHKVFKIGTRLAAACLGSVLPFGSILYLSGVLGKLDSGNHDIGLEFIVVALMFFAAWLISIIGAVNSEEKSIPKYIFLASVGPANLAILYRLIHALP